MRKKKPIVVAVSGGFDPLHSGHIKMFNNAKKLGDKLIVILNSDKFLIKKKGYIFMGIKERKKIIENIKAVDKVILCIDKDQTVRKTLERIKPDIFANGGDRARDNIPEKEVCDRLGIKLVFNVGGKKIQSSSRLVNKIRVRNN